MDAIINFPKNLKKENENSKNSEKNKLKEEKKIHEPEPLKEQQKIDKVAEIILKIVDEIEYLQEVKVTKPIKKDCIVQHIVSVIGQYMRDIQQADTKSYFPSISSALVAESFISVKRARSSGVKLFVRE